MREKSIIWVIGFLVLVVSFLGIIATETVIIDPFFHYHKPNTNKYFYTINNQRSQNDGIIKHFDYQGILTGTSMTENFKTSEAEGIWGGKFIKIPFSGATFKEINDNLIVALKNNSNLRVIIRGIDMCLFLDEKNSQREDLWKLPKYLYDKNIFNDVFYIFNRDVFFSRVCPMVKGVQEPGITSFDQYSNWMKNKVFGKNKLYPQGVIFEQAGSPIYLSDSDKDIVLGNVQQNITSLAQIYPNVKFYYFFTPYSAQWWQRLVESGKIYEQIQAERIVIEEILKCNNIKLYSFNNLFNITTNLNHYKDDIHYGEWINSMILKCIQNDICLLTYDNYENYLEKELQFYTSFDYMQMNEQEDYEDEYYAATLVETP